MTDFFAKAKNECLGDFNGKNHSYGGRSGGYNGSIGLNYSNGGFSLGGSAGYTYTYSPPEPPKVKSAIQYKGKIDLTKPPYDLIERLMCESYEIYMQKGADAKLWDVIKNNYFSNTGGGGVLGGGARFIGTFLYNSYSYEVTVVDPRDNYTRRVQNTDGSFSEISGNFRGMGMNSNFPKLYHMGKVPRQFGGFYVSGFGRKYDSPMITISTMNASAYSELKILHYMITGKR